MPNKILLIAVILVCNISAYAKPKIVTSITPIASIVAMLTTDYADIVTIDNAQGCPHHYQMKPSDLDKVTDAGMLIYIDDHFDSFIQNLKGKIDGKIIKLSNIKSVNFDDSSGGKNWHFWLDLDNILALHKELVTIISKEFPELKEEIEKNYDKSYQTITALKELKQHTMSSIDDIVVVSDSLEHFFHPINNQHIFKIYQNPNSSLKDYYNLEKFFTQQNVRCIVMDNHQNADVYQKFKRKLVVLDSENWQSTDNIETLFSIKYRQMLKQLTKCYN
ncbi:MAG: metal ABC transporter substrate-binding protein [Rickettsiaceae bacterium]